MTLPPITSPRLSCRKATGRYVENGKSKNIKIVPQEKGAVFQISNFKANKVFLVMGTSSGAPAKVTLKLNGETPGDANGKDAPGGVALTVNGHALYELISQKEPRATASLRLSRASPGRGECTPLRSGIKRLTAFNSPAAPSSGCRRCRLHHSPCCRYHRRGFLNCAPNWLVSCELATRVALAVTAPSNCCCATSPAVAPPSFFPILVRWISGRKARSGFLPCSSCELMPIWPSRT